VFYDLDGNAQYVGQRTEVMALLGYRCVTSFVSLSRMLRSVVDTICSFSLPLKETRSSKTDCYGSSKRCAGVDDSLAQTIGLDPISFVFQNDHSTSELILRLALSIACIIVIHHYPLYAYSVLTSYIST
jgi:hypothetical protein